MNATERKNEISRLAAQEAAAKATMEDLTIIHRGLTQLIEETETRRDAVEKELRRRYMEEFPPGTRVRIIGGIGNKGKVGRIRDIRSFTNEGIPIWSLWRENKSGAQSVFKFSAHYFLHEFERI